MGIIYSGNPHDNSDEEWLSHAREHMITYEVDEGGKPDHVIFQSWNNYPQYVLPESNPNVFTNLILSYLKTRTIFSMTVFNHQ